MNDDFSQFMTPFDRATSNSSLQLTKLLIPFLPSQNQRMMAVYVKFMEFQNTITYFRTIKQGTIEDIISCLPQSAAESFENIQNMMQMMNMFHAMQETDSEGADFTSMMTDMLSPEQQQMFDAYQAMFSEKPDNPEQKEGDTND